MEQKTQTILEMEATVLLEKTIEEGKKYKVICHEGGTRCFAKGTKVRMANGELESIENISTGDYVMGSDGKTPRRVIDTHKGIDNLYRVRQNRGIDYTVTGDHLLVLDQTAGFEKKVAIEGFKSYEKRRHITLPIPEDNRIEIRADEYMNRSGRFKRCYSGVKQLKIEFPEKELPVDPYYLGLWLGDGTSIRYYEITTGDDEILDYLKNVAKRFGSDIRRLGSYTYDIVCIKDGRYLARWKEVGEKFRELNLINNKHIPKEYLYGSYKSRLKLLAGIIDSDGCRTKKNTLAITMVNKGLMQDILELARITGFWTNGVREYVARMKRKDGSVYETKSYRIEINHKDFRDLNEYILLDRKRVKKDCSREYSSTKIDVQGVGIGDYYGFELEGDSLFLLEDGTIVHNSSKTYSIFQYWLLKALQGEVFRLTIARSKLTWVKSTLLLDFKEIIEKYNIPVTPEINVNRPDQVYNILVTSTSGNLVKGAEFGFFGLDNPQKIHGRKQDYLWLNEVMEIGRNDYDQLEMRTSKRPIILDYNPYDDSHWVFNLQKREDVCVIKSTMLDNPFLEQTIIDKIKSYEPTPENIERGTADLFMWEVYGRGNKARMQGAVFENWDIKELPRDERTGAIMAELKGYGLDFGYTNDPTALVELYIADDEIWLNQRIYKTGMINEAIAKEMELLGIDKSLTIWADSSEPKSIDEIHKYGWDIKPVQKGADSILYGIDILKSHKIHITPNSIDGESEMRKYKWAEDKSGNFLNRPIDAFNHFIDASRYVAMMTLGKERRTRVFTTKARPFR